VGTFVESAPALLGLYVVHGVVPDWVTAAIGKAVTGGLTFVAGWLAKHTPRTVAPPAPPVHPDRLKYFWHIFQHFPPASTADG
jgi:hypothetical protein